MKKNILVFLIALMVCSSGNSLAQKLNYRAYFGIGITDVVHVGVTRRFEMLDIAAQVGYLRHDLGTIISGGVGGSFRLGHSKKFVDAPTLFFKQLLNLHNDRNKGTIQWYWLTTELLMGRNFYLSERFGLSAEGGAIVTIYQTERHLKGSLADDPDDNDYPVIFPSARIQVFFRF